MCELKFKGAEKMTKKRKKVIILAIVIILLVVFILSPFFVFVRSMAVMGVYSSMNERESILADESIKLHIPGGLSTKEADWYPFTMTFNADYSYKNYIDDDDARLTILYNFPSYDYLKGCSNLYNTSSPYYNSFYGAYLVKDESNEALANHELDEETAASIARFDFFNLVLGDFGLKKDDEVFEFSITEREDGVSYVGYDDWTKITADILVNGSKHNKRENVQSYLQYGAPNFGEVSNEFEPVSMNGIVYGRYFPEWETGVYFYVMGKSEEICTSCDDEILSKSTLEGQHK